MFKLYDMNDRTMIAQEDNELKLIKDINQALEERIIFNESINLMIGYYLNEEPVQVFIHSFEDFIYYVQDCIKRHPEYQIGNGKAKTR